DRAGGGRDPERSPARTALHDAPRLRLARAAVPGERGVHPGVGPPFLAAPRDPGRDRFRPREGGPPWPVRAVGRRELAPAAGERCDTSRTTPPRPRRGARRALVRAPAPP